MALGVLKKLNPLPFLKHKLKDSLRTKLSKPINYRYNYDKEDLVNYISALKEMYGVKQALLEKKISLLYPISDNIDSIISALNSEKANTNKANRTVILPILKDGSYWSLLKLEIKPGSIELNYFDPTQTTQTSCPDYIKKTVDDFYKLPFTVNHDRNIEPFRNNTASGPSICNNIENIVLGINKNFNEEIVRKSHINLLGKSFAKKQYKNEVSLSNTKVWQKHIGLASNSKVDYSQIIGLVNELKKVDDPDFKQSIKESFKYDRNKKLEDYRLRVEKCLNSLKDLSSYANHKRLTLSEAELNKLVTLGNYLSINLCDINGKVVAPREILQETGKCLNNDNYLRKIRNRKNRHARDVNASEDQTETGYRAKSFLKASLVDETKFNEIERKLHDLAELYIKALQKNQSSEKAIDPNKKKRYAARARNLLNKIDNNLREIKTEIHHSNSDTLMMWFEAIKVQHLLNQFPGANIANQYEIFKKGSEGAKQVKTITTNGSNIKFDLIEPRLKDLSQLVLIERDLINGNKLDEARSQRSRINNQLTRIEQNIRQTFSNRAEDIDIKLILSNWLEAVANDQEKLINRDNSIYNNPANHYGIFIPGKGFLLKQSDHSKEFTLITKVQKNMDKRKGTYTDIRDLKEEEAIDLLRPDGPVSYKSKQYTPSEGEIELLKLKTGNASKVYFGIGIQGKFIHGKGYIVNSVYSGTPAEELGLEEGDRITHIIKNGQSVDMRNLSYKEVLTLLKFSPSERVMLRVTDKYGTELSYNLGEEMHIAPTLINTQYKTRHSYVEENRYQVKDRMKSVLTKEFIEKDVSAKKNSDLTRGLIRLKQKIENPSVVDNFCAEDKIALKLARKALKATLFDFDHEQRNETNEETFTDRLNQNFSQNKTAFREYNKPDKDVRRAEKSLRSPSTIGRD
jgi:hypothetical protein